MKGSKDSSHSKAQELLQMAKIKERDLCKTTTVPHPTMPHTWLVVNAERALELQTQRLPRRFLHFSTKFLELQTQRQNARHKR